MFADLVEPLLELSKCPDFVVNRGHYFGTSRLQGGAGAERRRQAGADRVPEDLLVAVGARRRAPWPLRPDGCEYVVVGSGAGGGTVAARLAEAGRRWCCSRRAATRRKLHGGDPVEPRTGCPTTTTCRPSTPSRPRTTAMKWDFFVRHYANDAQQRQDAKYRETRTAAASTACSIRGPATLGGCTAHNAMIMMYPHDADWDDIAELTGDRSVARRAHAPLLRAAGELPPPLALPLAAPSSASIPRATAGTAGSTTEKAHSEGCRSTTWRWSRCIEEAARARLVKRAATPLTAARAGSCRGPGSIPTTGGS